MEKYKRSNPEEHKDRENRTRNLRHCSVFLITIKTTSKTLIRKIENHINIKNNFGKNISN